jgi:hypothetical protein
MVSRYSTDLLMPKGIPKDGPRKAGCGRKAGEPTTTIAFRVPVVFKARLQLAMRNMISELKKQDPLN